MSKIREVLLAATILSLGLLFGASAYESVVMAPNYQARIPDSLEHVRQFMNATNPGTYFRVVAPLAQVLLLTSLVLSWRRPSGRRRWLLSAFLCIVVADVITFTFHYPRNDLLFGNPITTSAEELEAAARQWAYGNYARVLLIGIAMASGVWALRVSTDAKDV
jgi:hypothetical protein